MDGHGCSSTRPRGSRAERPPNSVHRTMRSIRYTVLASKVEISPGAIHRSWARNMGMRSEANGGD